MKDAEFEAAMAVGKPRRPSLAPPEGDVELPPTGEHRVVPRVIISPRKDYVESKSDPRRKPFIHVVRFTPDGRLLGCALSNGRIALYDATSGKARYNMDSADPRHERSMWTPEPAPEPEDDGGDVSRAPKMTISPMKMRTPSKHGDGRNSVTASVESLDLSVNTAEDDEHERPAVVAMRWFPSRTCHTDGHYKMLSTNSDGVIQRWRVTSPNDPEMVTYRSDKVKRTGIDEEEDDYDFDGTRCVESFMFAEGYDSAALGLDYDANGDRFAAACKDAVIRVFDNETSKVLTTLDGGSGADFQVESEFMLMGNMQRFYSVMERRRLQKSSAMEVINKMNIKQTGFELNRENVTMKKRHSNRVYGCKFTTGHTQIAENLIGSAGWDGTLQLWDLRSPGPAVKSYYGAFIAGDSLDIVGNDILTGSHRYENQLQIYDLRFDANPKNIQVTEGCLLYCAAFSKGEVDNPERFFCAGGVGPGKGSNDLTIFDHKRDNRVSAVLQDLPGGVVSLDWDPLHTHPPVARSPINSSKGSVPGGILAIGCGDSSIRIVEMCTARSSKFIDDAEEEVEDGDETDSELFEGYMDMKYGDDPEAVKRVRIRRSKHVGIPLPSDSPLSSVRQNSPSFKFQPPRTTIILGNPGDNPKICNSGGDTAPPSGEAASADTGAGADEGEEGGGKVMLTSQSEPVLLSPRSALLAEAEEEEGEDEDETTPLRALRAPKASKGIGTALAAPLLSPMLSPLAADGTAGAQEDSASASYDEFALLAGNHRSGKAEVDAQIDDFLSEN